MGAPVNTSTHQEPEHRRWYLGIDIGAAGIAAALLDSDTGRHHQIHWLNQENPEPIQFLRLPAVAYLTAEQLAQEPDATVMVGDRAVKAAGASEPEAGLVLGNFRHLLSIAVPYRLAQTDWQPVVQWSEQQTVLLAWVQEAISAMLATLRPTAHPALTCTAVDLQPDVLQAALSQLAGVIFGSPVEQETYHFNLREAVLAAGLVNQPEQIYFIQDAIAALMAQLPVPTPTDEFSIPEANLPKPLAQECTLVLSAGANSTELLLVDLQTSPQPHPTDLYGRSFAYAGNAIDQDIICQLFYPSVWGWRTLGSPSLDLPLAGEPDLAVRYRLQQRLRDNARGKSLLQIARQLKVALTQQKSFTVNFEGQSWTMTQQDFHNRVIIPYIQLLNRELNMLLTQAEITARSVKQIICTGGSTAISAIAPWLQQKFPKATLLQNVSNSAESNSQIAIGLARLPLFAHLLDVHQHQYSGYFLLKQLLELLPDQPLSLSSILKLLEAHNIEPQKCQDTVLNLLEGQLPSGLVPARQDFVMLTPDSRQNPDYQTLTTGMIFSRQGNQIYQLDPTLRDAFSHYFSALLQDKHQTLTAPLPVDLAVNLKPTFKI